MNKKQVSQNKNVRIYNPELFSPSKTITGPFTEQEIIEVQNALFTNGFQHLTLANVYAGRTIIEFFLTPVNYFHDIAYLTVVPGMLPHSVEPILDTINYYEHEGANFLSQYFLDEFTYDFLVIELTPELEQLSWFDDFRQGLLDFKLHTSIPIIIMSYDYDVDNDEYDE